ncbi:ATPase, V0 complex, subunit E1/e2 [Scheffersomyces xylosifermentans]|uniref:ATPase, V0 complex, subunit E1/e2 n=1 Tax=Scheffersomyces xylosifermentans TaxID=1304137 RepID=UPI00315D4FF7
MSGYTVIIVFIFVAALSTLAWIFAPKENRTVFRSSVILCLAMCYLMWAITYLAQLHPLEAPRRSDLRPEKHD